MKRNSLWILGCILVFYFCIATYRLTEIPGEWFGDIDNLHEYVRNIERGKWPISFSQGVGPLYHYIITPFVSRTEHFYIHYKILSVCSGALSLIFVYLLGITLFGNPVALLATLLTACSFWFIVWARLGNLHAILPGIVSLTVYFAKKYHDTKQWRYFLGGVLASASGMFFYLGTFLLPLVFVSLVVLSQRINKKEILRMIVIATICFLPFLLFFLLGIYRDPAQFVSPQGYVGEKMKLFSTFSPGALLLRFVSYVGQTIGMLFVRGDVVFRINVPNDPLLDPVSRVFFLIGCMSLIRRKFAHVRHSIFLPIGILSLLAVLPTLDPLQVPSATRTIGTMPFIFLLVALGISSSFRFLKNHLGTLPMLLFVPTIGLIIVFNLAKYFHFYPISLPNHNSPFGRIIAEYVDTLPKETTVLLTDCCWGDWGQPDGKSMYYQLQNKLSRESLLWHTKIESCDLIQRYSDTVFLLNPANTAGVLQLKTCVPEAVGKTHQDRLGQKVFTSVVIQKNK